MGKLYSKIGKDYLDMSRSHSAPLVGLVGRKRAGKDTFAAVLVEQNGYTRASFADPLREAAYRLDPIVEVESPREAVDADLPQFIRLSAVVDALGWERAKDEVQEVRTVLQRLGTDAIRALDPDFWVRTAVDKLDPEVPTVFTDVRFPNEADAIRARGGIIVRIERDLPDDGDRHPSETALDDYDVDATIDDPDGGRTVEELQHEAYKFSLVAELEFLGEES